VHRALADVVASGLLRGVLIAFRHYSDQRRRITRACIWLVLLGIPTSAILAQTVRAVDAALNQGDTARALSLLRQELVAGPGNAAAWHRIGSLASAKSRPVRRLAFIRDQRDIDFLRLADSSLYRATQLAPDSARYALDYAQHLFGASVSTAQRAFQFLERALAAAQRSGDSPLIGAAADALGMLSWRRYETVANRRINTAGPNLQIDALLTSSHGARDYLEQHTRAYEPPLGERQRTDAARYFAIAHQADAANQSASRHLYLVLAEKGDWLGLLRAAALRFEKVPWDADAWLGRGLANHRLSADSEAAMSFDSALALLPDSTRRYMTRLTRLLKPQDSVLMMKTADLPRQQMERLFWLTADPLALTPGNEYWLEYLSRVVEADLRWTMEDFNLRGADTDRGEIWIRYGPPEVMASFARSSEEIESCTQAQGSSGESFLPKCDAMGGALGVSLAVWYYPALNLHFVFRSPPMYGTASFAERYEGIAAEARNAASASWTNLPIERNSIRNMQIQVTRFRASRDSSDLLVFAEVPVGWLASHSAAPNVVDVALSTFSLHGSRVSFDSSRASVVASSSKASEQRSWRVRLPHGKLLYRVEALQPESSRAARALGEIQLSAEKGFGVSDLLVAGAISPRRDGAERWSDFVLSPSVGKFRRGETVGLLWETYGLASRDGGNAYRVAVTVIPSGGSKQSVAARIVGGVREAIGQAGRADAKVTLGYSRSHTAKPVSVDYLSLDVRALSEGSYRLVVTLTDLVTNMTVERTREIIIADGG